MKKSIIVLSSAIVLSCSQETSTIKKVNFDLAGVIQNQVNQLSKTKPTVSKTVFLNTEKEDIRTADIDWSKELSLFLEADLNKQAYQRSYEVAKTDSTEFYSLKSTENLPVKSLKLFFDTNKTLKHVEADLQTKNYLYESEKHLSLDLSEESLKHYEINTSQELFIGKKKNFKVIGHIEK